MKFPPIGGAGEAKRTGQGSQEFSQIRRVASEIAKRIGEPDGREPAATQGANLGVEAGRVGPRTVHEDDRRGLTGHYPHRFLLGRSRRLRRRVCGGGVTESECPTCDQPCWGWSPVCLRG